MAVASDMGVNAATSIKSPDALAPVNTVSPQIAVQAVSFLSGKDYADS